MQLAKAESPVTVPVAPLKTTSISVTSINKQQHWQDQCNLWLLGLSLEVSHSQGNWHAHSIASQSQNKMVFLDTTTTCLPWDNNRHQRPLHLIPLISTTDFTPVKIQRHYILSLVLKSQTDGIAKLSDLKWDFEGFRVLCTNLGTRMRDHSNLLNSEDSVAHLYFLPTPVL